MNRLASVRVDAAGRLWIWTEDPNTMVLYEQGKFRAFLKGTDFDADYIYNVSLDEGGPRFRFGDDEYVYNQGKFERRPAAQRKLPRVFREGDSKVVWISTNDGYYATTDKESTFYPKDGRLPLDPQKATALEAVEIDEDIPAGNDPPVGPVNDSVTCTSQGAATPCTVTVLKTTLEEPPNQGIGGGYNSTLSSGTITTGTPLPNGQSILLSFKLGVQKTGTFRFYIIVEALP